MQRNPFTDRQIEVSNLLQAAAGEGITSELVDEIITMVGDAEQRTDYQSIEKEETESQIKIKLMNEPDWRKRASLAAMIISKNLS